MSCRGEVFDALLKPAVTNPLVTAIQFVSDARERPRGKIQLRPRFANGRGARKFANHDEFPCCGQFFSTSEDHRRRRLFRPRRLIASTRKKLIAPAVKQTARSSGCKTVKRKSFDSDGIYRTAARNPKAPETTHQNAGFPARQGRRSRRDQERLAEIKPSMPSTRVENVSARASSAPCSR